MQVAQLPMPPPVSPFSGEDNQIQRARTLHLQPALSTRSGCVGGIDGFGHDTFVPAVQRLLQEFAGTFRV
jgi:hypothetical protein